MGRKPCCEKVGLKRGPWTADEDGKLVSYITTHGICCWRAIPKLAGLLRCGKSCRLRWTNYLRPDLKRGIFTEDEENLILDLHSTLGNRWSRIAAQLPGRTDNEIKNYWNTRLKKRLRSQGLDPATHLPLDSSKLHEDGDDSDGDSTESGKKPDAARPKEPAKPARQPRGPKPAPQLKMCQSDDGPVLLKVTTSSKCDGDGDDSPCPSTCSTVTTNVEEPQAPALARKLSSVPSFPEAELWKCIKPSGASSPLASAALLDEWDSCSLLLSSTTAASKDGIDMAPSAHDLGAGIFQGTCEMGAMPWSMDVEPAPESLFAPNPAGFYNREPAPHPSQDLQKLAALLDLI